MGFDNASTLSGLFYIISNQDEKCGYLETFLSWNHFWGNALQQPSFTPFSNNSNNVFEYLEVCIYSVSCLAAINYQCTHCRFSK